MKSKITGGVTDLIFKARVLNKYEVNYYKCRQTGFIQTEEPYWLTEAYSSAITKLDLGLPFRNESFREKVIRIINKYFEQDARFLDYAGGYGLFTRLMRDQGFNFYHTDKYCQNIFAEYFELKDIGEGTTFELTTAFEVFEHMADPLNEITAMSGYSDNLLFTTELQPEKVIHGVEDWWYFVPETGQHISFHTPESLKFIAGVMGYNFYSDRQSMHLFTRKTLSDNPFSIPRDPFLIRKMRRLLNKFDHKENPEKESFLNKDWNYVKSKLN
jgi:hypothetical protein